MALGLTMREPTQQVAGDPQLHEFFKCKGIAAIRVQNVKVSATTNPQVHP